MYDKINTQLSVPKYDLFANNPLAFNFDLIKKPVKQSSIKTGVLALTCMNQMSINLC